MLIRSGSRAYIIGAKCKTEYVDEFWETQHVFAVSPESRLCPSAEEMEIYVNSASLTWKTSRHTVALIRTKLDCNFRTTLSCLGVDSAGNLSKAQIYQHGALSGAEAQEVPLNAG